MSKVMPWVKWSYADWLRDPGLRLCSLSARGLWMDMLAHMDADDERGHLTVNGKAATNAEIARRIGVNTLQADKLIKELKARGVLSRDERGAIYNRRMLRDNARIESGRAAGLKGGGNPALKPATPPVTHPVTHPVTPIVTPPDDDGVHDKKTTNNNDINEKSGTDTYIPDLDKEENKSKVQPPSGARPASAGPPPAVPGNVVSLNPVLDAFWGEGLPLIQRLFPRHTDRAHRGMLGKLTKESGDRHQAVVLVLRDALNRGVVDPAPWILQAVKVKGGVSLVDAGSADRRAQFEARYGSGPVGPEHQGQTIEGAAV